ncbi:MAG: hypothetical protein WEA58_01430 [Balneolaceae bacterium]
MSSKALTSLFFCEYLEYLYSQYRGHNLNVARHTIQKDFDVSTILEEKEII